jgi:hypothetical protein
MAPPDLHDQLGHRAAAGAGSGIHGLERGIVRSVPAARSREHELRVSTRVRRVGPVGRASRPIVAALRPKGCKSPICGSKRWTRVRSLDPWVGRSDPESLYPAPGSSPDINGRDRRPHGSSTRSKVVRLASVDRGVGPVGRGCGPADSGPESVESLPEWGYWEKMPSD